MSQPFTIVDWQDDQVVLLDQRKLPEEEVYVHCAHVDSLIEAICNMTVRGAPAIGTGASHRRPRLWRRRSSPCLDRRKTRHRSSG